MLVKEFLRGSSTVATVLGRACRKLRNASRTGRDRAWKWSTFAPSCHTLHHRALTTKHFPMQLRNQEQITSPMHCQALILPRTTAALESRISLTCVTVLVSSISRVRHVQEMAASCQGDAEYEEQVRLHSRRSNVPESPTFTIIVIFLLHNSSSFFDCFVL